MFVLVLKHVLVAIFREKSWGWTKKRVPVLELLHEFNQLVGLTYLLSRYGEYLQEYISCVFSTTYL